MKSRTALIVKAALLAGALALAAPAVAGAAGPAKGGHGSTTTTTTTKPGSSGGQSAPFATLVIKAASIGHVSVETAGTTSFQPGTNNEQLHVGDTVQTDSVGLAEIDYATNAWTRLNVSTTFTIKKLTDNQGNRQIDGGITSGETWNRTAELTQSESFTQDGGGVSAAVSGTAFVVDCTTPTQCTFTAVIDDTHLTGPNGQTQTLNPLTQCVTQNSALCATPTMLTPDQVALIQWIQSNVLLDFTEHGIGNGIFDPFGATVTVTNGVVTSVTPTTNPAGTTPAPNPPPPSPAIDPTNPILLVGGPFTPTACGVSVGSTTCPPTPAHAIVITDEQAQNFQLNLSNAELVFFLLPADLSTGPNPLAAIVDVTHGNETVLVNTAYNALDTFQLKALDISGFDLGTTSFQYSAVGSGGVSTSAPVQVKVSPDCSSGGGDDTCTSAATTPSSVATQPATASGATTPSSTPAPALTPTSTTSSTPSTPSTTTPSS